jgi:2-polyprenyl-3-methyl-5-hydroxy-6-metoxy-1,4-benzoquinol methylase
VRPRASDTLRPDAGAGPTATPVGTPRVAVLVADPAAAGVASVVDRIPPEVRDRIEEIAAFDDAVGHGGNQKAGYAYFAERGVDIVVVLPAHGRHAPDILDRLYEPIAQGRADMVVAARVLDDPLAALRSGRPLQCLGHWLLTRYQNRALGTNLSDSGSGYRAYSLRALERIDLSSMTDDVHFDTQILVKLHHQGMRIGEVPMPSHGEDGRPRGIRHALDVVGSVFRYRRTCSGAACAPEFAEYFPHYPFKDTPGSSHRIALGLARHGKRVLDIGCGDGQLAARLAADGHEVFGIDVLDAPAHRDALVGYARSDLADGLEGLSLDGRSFDTILLLDVLEHLPEPERLLADVRARLAPGGVTIVSVPNVANVTVRLALLAGRFPYADRGILDRTHLRFYTRRSARALLQRCGFEAVEQTDSVMPVELALGLSARSRSMRAVNRVLRTLTRLAPGLLSYQTVIVARVARGGDG